MKHQHISELLTAAVRAACICHLLFQECGPVMRTTICTRHQYVWHQWLRQLSGRVSVM